MSFGTQMSEARKLREELDPADLTLVGEYYLGPNEEMSDAYNGQFDPSLHELTGQCEHCGTNHLHGVLFMDVRDGSHLAVGSNCADSFFNFKSKIARKVAQAKKRIATRKKRERIAAEAVEFVAARPGLLEALKFDHRIIYGIGEQLRRNGSISQKQVDLVFKIAAEETQREADKASEPAPVAIPAELLEGRYEFTGVVLGFKDVDSPWGVQTKLILREDRGFKLYGTSINAGQSYGHGDRVAFSARIEASEKDPTFGFFSRPTKGRVVGVTESE